MAPRYSQPDGPRAPIAPGAFHWMSDALQAERALLVQDLEKRHEALLVEFDKQLRGQFSHRISDDLGPLESSTLDWILRHPVGKECAKEVLEVQKDVEEDSKPSASCSKKTSVSRNSTLLRTQLSLGFDHKLHSCQHRIAHMVERPWFELIFATLILMNALGMSFEAQYTGMDVGNILGFPGSVQSAENSWPGMKIVFRVLELFFGFAFTFEVVAKLLAQTTTFFKSAWNLFDLLLILVWLWTQWQTNELPMNPMVLRLARIIRLVRLLRLVRMFQVFDVLHILIAALRSSTYVLLWSAMFLLLIMMVAALGMVYSMEPYISDEETEIKDRMELYKYFGTFSRAMLTVFEVTLGNWVPVTRLVHEKVTELFGVYMIIYRALIGEAVVKVITGIFICETFKAAASDDELMIMQKDRQQQKYIEKMHYLFTELDDSGDGYLHYEEFKEVVDDKRVCSWLKAMDIDVRDAKLVFQLLDNGDHKLSAQEVVGGFSRLKGAARSIDLAICLQELRHLQQCVDVQYIDKLDERLKDVCTKQRSRHTATSADNDL